MHKYTTLLSKTTLFKVKNVIFVNKFLFLLLSLRMDMEKTLQQIKDMLGRSESCDVIAHCDYIIEKEDNGENKKYIAQLFYLRGNAYRQLGEWGKAMSSWLEASERDPESPAKQAYAHALEILDFYNHDLYNP